MMLRETLEQLVKLHREHASHGSQNEKFLQNEPESGRFVDKPFIQLGNNRCIGEIVGLALEFQCGSNCRYSDLAIAAIKIIPAVVLTASDYIVRGHFFSAEFGACLT